MTHEEQAEMDRLRALLRSEAACHETERVISENRLAELVRVTAERDAARAALTDELSEAVGGHADTEGGGRAAMTKDQVRAAQPKRYKTGSYGAMVEDENGAWMDAETALSGINYWYERAMRAEATRGAYARSALPPEGPEGDYQRGRLSVMRELTEAVERFNADDSLGLGQLIEVIQPWLDPPEGPAEPRACATCQHRQLASDIPWCDVLDVDISDAPAGFHCNFHSPAPTGEPKPSEPKKE